MHATNYIPFTVRLHPYQEQQDFCYTHDASTYCNTKYDRILHWVKIGRSMGSMAKDAKTELSISPLKLYRQMKTHPQTDPPTHTLSSSLVAQMVEFNYFVDAQHLSSQQLACLFQCLIACMKRLRMQQPYMSIGAKLSKLMS